MTADPGLPRYMAKWMAACAGIVLCLAGVLYAHHSTPLPERTYAQDFRGLDVTESVAKAGEYDVFLTVVNRTHQTRDSAISSGRESSPGLVADIVVYAKNRRTLRPYAGAVRLLVDSRDELLSDPWRACGKTAEKDMTARFRLTRERAFPARITVTLDDGRGDRQVAFEAQLGSSRPNVILIGGMILVVLLSACGAIRRNPKLIITNFKGEGRQDACAM